MLVDDRTTGGGATAGEARVIPTEVADSLGELLRATLAAEGVHGAAEAGLHLVDVAEMTELNRQAMGQDSATDVLSFPLDAGAEPNAIPQGPGSLQQPDAAGHPQDVPLLVGDVVLCVEVARRNAPEHAGTLIDECRLLVVHGALHLCGWDHDAPAQRSAMWQRERELMASLGVSPSHDPWGSG